MMTQSHVLVTAFVGDRLHRRGAPVRRLAFTAGALLPDVPLILLTLGYAAWRSWVEPLRAGEPLFGAHYDALYFGDPLWIVATSLFHAPLLIALYALWARHARRPGLWWMAAGCGLHTAIDVFTHRSDGPLLLFPFDWSYRYPAPVSYWNPDFGGATFAFYENVLNLAIVGYFLVLGLGWLVRRAIESRRPNRGFAE